MTTVRGRAGCQTGPNRGTIRDAPAGVGPGMLSPAGQHAGHNRRTIHTRKLSFSCHPLTPTRLALEPFERHWPAATASHLARVDVVDERPPLHAPPFRARYGWEHHCRNAVASESNRRPSRAARFPRRTMAFSQRTPGCAHTTATGRLRSATVAMPRRRSCTDPRAVTGALRGPPPPGPASEEDRGSTIGDLACCTAPLCTSRTSTAYSVWRPCTRPTAGRRPGCATSGAWRPRCAPAVSRAP